MDYLNRRYDGKNGRFWAKPFDALGTLGRRSVVANWTICSSTTKPSVNPTGANTDTQSPKLSYWEQKKTNLTFSDSAEVPVRGNKWVVDAAPGWDFSRPLGKCATLHIERSRTRNLKTCTQNRHWQAYIGMLTNLVFLI